MDKLAPAAYLCSASINIEIAIRLRNDVMYNTNIEANSAYTCLLKKLIGDVI